MLIVVIALVFIIGFLSWFSYMDKRIYRIVFHSVNDLNDFIKYNEVSDLVTIIRISDTTLYCKTYFKFTLLKTIISAYNVDSKDISIYKN